MSAYRTHQAILIAALLCAAGPQILRGQGSTGPIPAPSAGDIVHLPSTPVPEATAVPPEEIIKRFAAHEDEYAKAGNTFSYHKKLLLEEIGDDGKPANQAEVNTIPQVNPDGSRYEHLVNRPKSTLKIVSLTPEDLETFASFPMFPFTTDQLPNYTIKYQGQQPLDQLQTYIFSIEPKRLDRKRSFFSGVIWVDDHDFAIVKTYGRWVTELGDVTSPELPFSIFETYRQPVGDNWFPAYFRSDSEIALKDVTVPIRLVIYWTDYAPFPAVQLSAPAPSTPSPATGPPAPPH
jgi:hypothetical protein